MHYVFNFYAFTCFFVNSIYYFLIFSKGRKHYLLSLQAFKIVLLFTYNIKTQKV